jgi:hypothetical protein
MKEEEENVGKIMISIFTTFPFSSSPKKKSQQRKKIFHICSFKKFLSSRIYHASFRRLQIHTWMWNFPRQKREQAREVKV